MPSGGAVSLSRSRACSISSRRSPVANHAGRCSCTANDVRVATVSATVLDGQLCQCDPGSCQYSYVDVLFVVYVEAIASTRYDVTVYLSNDGQTIAPPVSTDCLGWAAIPGEGIGYYTPPYCSHFGVFTNNDGDGCGDITKVQSPVFANITARVSCANVNVNGTLVVPAVITWEQGSASGCTVSSFGGTGSKCVSENVTFTDLLPPCQSKVCPANDQCTNYSVEPPACCQIDSDCGPAENCSYYNCTSNACVLTSVDCEASSSSSQLPESSETWFTVTLPGYFLLDPISLAFIPLLCLLGAIVAFRRHHHHHHNHRKGHQGH
jgi:hypothetical protein